MGRGAFANRDIQEGSLVAPVPLIHIPDETVLDMHKMAAAELENGDSIIMRDTNEKIGIQLLLNYCWGHPQSTQLFFPAGAVVSYINHAPSKDKVNAKMVWSSHAENKLDLLDESLPNFTDLGSLVVEIVATRDIEEGEESESMYCVFVLRFHLELIWIFLEKLVPSNTSFCHHEQFLLIMATSGKKSGTSIPNCGTSTKKILGPSEPSITTKSTKRSHFEHWKTEANHIPTM